MIQCHNKKHLCNIMRYNIVIPILYYNIERFDGKKILLFIKWSDLKFLLFKEATDYPSELP